MPKPLWFSLLRMPSTSILFSSMRVPSMEAPTAPRFMVIGLPVVCDCEGMAPAVSVISCASFLGAVQRQVLDRLLGAEIGERHRFRLQRAGDVFDGDSGGDGPNHEIEIQLEAFRQIQLHALGGAVESVRLHLHHVGSARKGGETYKPPWLVTISVARPVHSSFRVTWTTWIPLPDGSRIE